MICNNPQCFVRKDTVLSPHDLTFLLIKRKKNYKAKFSTNLILKKIDKNNFGKKKPLNYKRKNNISNTHYYINTCGWAWTHLNHKILFFSRCLLIRIIPSLLKRIWPWIIIVLGCWLTLKRYIDLVFVILIFF
jgi:hypothetical protein